MLHSLPASSKNWKVDSRLFSQAEDARLTVYESLRARTVPLSPGGWRLVLDHAQRGEQPPAVSSLVTGWRRHCRWRLRGLLGGRACGTSRQ